MLRLRQDMVRIATQAVDLAREKVDLQRDRQRAGTGRNLEVLAAEVEMREKELARVAAVFAYEMLAIEWCHATGSSEAIASSRLEEPVREASSTR